MKFTNRTILFLILSVAVILRFFNYFGIPFMHDEFSALFRLNFESFSELIENGVKIDGHPAGIQVFLYYWTKLFGYREWVIKLPFAVMGVASVYFVYGIGKKWFNETVGLLSAAYVASIQFTVMYSQIARPYMSGMFFSLLMVYYWSNLMSHPTKSFHKNYWLFIISAALCAYNHHFSLLFVAIVGLSGLFFIQKKYLLRYVLSGVVIFVLYIPHLNIFFYQLNTGGVEGWLAKPQNDFLVQFIAYIFHYSFFVVAVTAAIFLFAVLNREKNAATVKRIVLAFVWFVLPVLIGFFYSKYVNAVLQYSVLIFSFYTLFFVVFGFIKPQSTKINLVLVSVILLTTVSTLVYSRKHYTLFNNSVYEHILTDYESLKNENEQPIFIVDSHENITNYYVSKLNIDTNFIRYSEAFGNSKEFKRFLAMESKTNNKIYLGALSSFPPNLIPLIRDYFPVIEQQNNYFGGATYLFSKGSKQTDSAIDCLNFDKVTSEWWSSIDSSRIVADSSANRSYLMDSGIEWGPKFSVPLKEVINNENNYIDITIDAKTSGTFEEIIIVATLESKGESIYWGGTDFSEFELPERDTSAWQRFHHSIKLSDIDLKSRDIMLNIFIWNKGQKEFRMDNFTISLRDGNPYIYSLYEKF